jgi:hypothetical protein
MHYKTIVLELIQGQPKLHDQLRNSRTLLATVNQVAAALKESHEAWKEQLAQARPGSDPSQIASEALELAMNDLLESLPSEPEDNMQEPFSLDAAMNYLRRHTPPG